MKYKQIMLQVIYVKKSQLVHFVQCFTAKSSSHDKIHKDDYDNEYIKLKNSWDDPLDLEVYFDGGWKENGDKMVRLHDPVGQANLAFDPFTDPESKANCYYIDLTPELSTPKPPTPVPTPGNEWSEKMNSDTDN